LSSSVTEFEVPEGFSRRMEVPWYGLGLWVCFCAASWKDELGCLEAPAWVVSFVVREPVAISLIVDFDMVYGVWEERAPVLLLLLLGVYFLISLCAEAEVASVCVEERRDWFYPGFPKALVLN
jgi:hypothetical protein